MAALTFSSTYFLRPLGALFFGYLGDKYGRKSTVVITTMLMALTSFVTASLPTYEKIGITASFVIIICRMLQGFSAVGEVVGARVYISEITTPPHSYYYTTMLEGFAAMGSLFALLIGAIFVYMDVTNGWRLAFYFGASIAVIGSIARSSIKETPEFLRVKSSSAKIGKKLKDFLPKITKDRNFLCYIGVECLYPVCFYICYIYLGGILKDKFNFSTKDVLAHNLCVGVVEVSFKFIYAHLAFKFNPMNIIKIRTMLFALTTLLFPVLFINGIGNLSIAPIFAIQFFLVTLGLDSIPAHAVFIKSFPIIGRYTQAALVIASSKTVMLILSAYGCVFVGEYFGFCGISTVLFTLAVIYVYSVSKFKVDNDSSNEHKKKHDQNPIKIVTM